MCHTCFDYTDKRRATACVLVKSIAVSYCPVPRVSTYTCIHCAQTCLFLAAPRPEGGDLAPRVALQQTRPQTLVSASDSDLNINHKQLFYRQFKYLSTMDHIRMCTLTGISKERMTCLVSRSCYACATDADTWSRSPKHMCVYMYGFNEHTQGSWSSTQIITRMWCCVD